MPTLLSVDCTEGPLRDQLFSSLVVNHLCYEVNVDFCDSCFMVVAGRDLLTTSLSKLSRHGLDESCRGSDVASLAIVWLEVRLGLVPISIRPAGQSAQRLATNSKQHAWQAACRMQHPGKLSKSTMETNHTCWADISWSYCTSLSREDHQQKGLGLCRSKSRLVVEIQLPQSILPAAGCSVVKCPDISVCLFFNRHLLAQRLLYQHWKTGMEAGR